MEDAMILNKASFERGFAHASVYKCEVHAGRMYLYTCTSQNNALYMYIPIQGRQHWGGGGGQPPLLYFF